MCFVKQLPYESDWSVLQIYITAGDWVGPSVGCLSMGLWMCKQAVSLTFFNCILCVRAQFAHGCVAHSKIHLQIIKYRVRTDLCRIVFRQDCWIKDLLTIAPKANIVRYLCKHAIAFNQLQFKHINDCYIPIYIDSIAKSALNTIQILRTSVS